MLQQYYNSITILLKVHKNALFFYFLLQFTIFFDIIIIKYKWAQKKGVIGWEHIIYQEM